MLDENMGKFAKFKKKKKKKKLLSARTKLRFTLRDTKQLKGKLMGIIA
jgi:hypothetical protein